MQSCRGVFLRGFKEDQGNRIEIQVDHCCWAKKLHNMLPLSRQIGEQVPNLCSRDDRIPDARKASAFIHYHQGC